MANERDDKLEGQEEEYHFSDEQMDYEAEGSGVPEEPKSKPAGDFKDTFVEKLKNNRRYVLGIGAVILLVYIVYKMISPPATQSTDIQATQSPPIKTMPAMTPATPKPAMVANPTPKMPVVAVPVVTAPPPADAVKVAMDQQNAKLNYLEEQNNTLQGKVQDLTTRITNIESGLTQITQLLQGGAKPPVAAVAAPPASATTTTTTTTTKIVEPKIMYSVQAIIPGRAWLKSDEGDTVTVAEGDILKDFGRVTKIDPYDGLVDIDTGSRIISLTYGGGAS